jgi:Fur family transcriptional regulator, ferric uptake regulator
VRRNGGRVTSARRILLTALFEAAGHVTAEDLAERVQRQAPELHRSTIYRNLEELERLGIVVHTHTGHGPATYHLSSVTHGHFVCQHCGAMIEVPVDLFDELRRAAASDFGFAIDPEHVAVLGRCADCH